MLSLLVVECPTTDPKLSQSTEFARILAKLLVYGYIISRLSILFYSSVNDAAKQKGPFFSGHMKNGDLSLERRSDE